MRILLAAVFLAPALAVAGPLAADDCAAPQRSCLAQCDKAYPPSRDDMGHTGCAARCNWEGTACAAQQALDQTQAALDRDLKPWLADQAGKWQRFLDGFRGRPPEPPQSRPDGPFGRNPSGPNPSDRSTSL
ncbi:MAG: hypothetical protein WDO24_19965 [Pseudomonadota bacterium]